MTPEQYYEEPSTRSWVEWTPARIVSAEMLADAGDFRLAADLCDLIAADDRVQGVLPVRARGLLGLPFSFERSARRSRGHVAAVRALEAEEDWYAMAPSRELADLQRWAILLGVAIAQLVWRQGPRERLIPTLDVWHPHGLRRDSQTGSWTIRTASGEVDAQEPLRWLLHAPSGLKRPQGCWRSVARWALLKQYARSDWGVQGERSAGIRVAIPPLPQAGSPNENGKTNRAALAEELKRLARNGGLVLPAGWDIKIVQAEARTWETFKAQIDVANSGIAIALAGQNLTSEVKGGSYAAAEVHQQIANVLLRADADALSETLHDRLLVPWAEYNLAGRDQAPWPSWDTSPPEDLATKGAAWSALVDAGTKAEAALAAAGSTSTVDWDEIIRLGAIPVRKRAE